MKKIVIAVLLLASFNAFSQTEISKEKKWTFGFGFNVIDNTSTFKSEFVNPNDNWNVSLPLAAFSIERQIGTYFAGELSCSYNKISKNKLQNGSNISKDLYYLGFDLNGKFYVDKLISKKSPIGVYLLAGVGEFSSNDKYNQSGNAGIGLVYMFKPNLGLRIQTIGKFAKEMDQVLNNHIQHTAELVFKF